MPVRGARLEDRLGVEGGLRATPSDHDATGAVAQDVGVRALDGPQHARGHRGSIHPELGVHAGHHDVELRQQVLVLVQRTVLKDVDLNPAQDAKRRQLFVQLLDDLELLPQPLGVEAVGDRQSGAVIGQGPIGVAQLLRRFGHFTDRAAAVRPVRVAVAVTLQPVEQTGRLGAQGREVVASSFWR